MSKLSCQKRERKKPLYPASCNYDGKSAQPRESKAESMVYYIMLTVEKREKNISFPWRLPHCCWITGKYVSVDLTGLCHPLFVAFPNFDR